MQTTTLEMTRHARHRSAQRKPPAHVMGVLRRGGGTDFPCGHPAYRGVTLRVVRTSDAYWIAAHRAGDLVTGSRRRRWQFCSGWSTYVHAPVSSSSSVLR